MRKPASRPAIPTATPERVAELLLVSGLPPAYRDWTLETYDVTDANREAFEAVTAYAPDDRSLYVGGQSGSGKTRLACGLLLRLIERAVVCKYANVPDLLERCFARDEDDRPDLDRLILPPLCRVLILDDIGFGTYVGWKREAMEQTLYRLINGRIEHGVPTVYTSNLPCGGEEMRKRLGDPIVSRIARECEVVTAGAR
ncbi:MAG: ATP-binding protein [Gemmatimonadaceae bacterium]